MERLLRPGGVGALHGKAHVDQYPVTWGEVLFLESGYEGFNIRLRQYSATGFTPTDLAYGGGC